MRSVSVFACSMSLSPTGLHVPGELGEPVQAEAPRPVGACWRRGQQAFVVWKEACVGKRNKKGRSERVRDQAVGTFGTTERQNLNSLPRALVSLQLASIKQGSYLI